MSDRACAGTNSAGDPCGAAPLKGKDHCAAHDPEAPASSRFGSPAQAREAGRLGGRPALPKPSDIARRLIEENELALQRPYWRTLGYDVRIGNNGPELVELDEGGAKLFGTSKDGLVRVSSHEDLEAMQRAAERLQDRVYGRPKQQTEISGPEGAPIEVVPIAPDPDRAATIAALLRDQGAISED